MKGRFFALIPRQQLHAETVQQLTPVLTPSQLKKFEVLMEEERGPRGRGPHGG